MAASQTHFWHPELSSSSLFEQHEALGACSKPWEIKVQWWFWAESSGEEVHTAQLRVRMQHQLVKAPSQLSVRSCAEPITSGIYANAHCSLNG